MIDFFLIVLSASWSVLGEMAPYLLLGFFFAGLLSVMVSPRWVERHLGGNRIAQVFKASLFGVPLPLCSCGVLPVAASLRRNGAGKGATTAFLLSTPQTGVDSIAVTWALLGPFLAVFRPIAALVTGVLGGYFVQVFDKDDAIVTEEPLVQSCSSAGKACSTPGDTADDGCCSGEASSSSGRWRQALVYGFATLPRDIGKALFVGIIISGALTALIEPNLLREYLGGGFLPMFAAMLIGVPLYVCATASTPIALGLIHAGLSPGAALVFLISGPATNAAALTTLWKILGRRTAVIYLITVVICALGAGLLVDLAMSSGVAEVSVSAMDDAGHVHGESSIRSMIENVSAIVLLGVLAFALWPRTAEVQSSQELAGASGTSEHLELIISGMRCNGCVTSLTRALNECGGVQTINIDLAGKSVIIVGQGLKNRQIADAVASLGFKIEDPEVVG